eukprot:SM000102S09179  [mRNA]  locus=s102:35488:36946:- [translate_table: standard]
MSLALVQGYASDEDRQQLRAAAPAAGDSGGEEEEEEEEEEEQRERNQASAAAAAAVAAAAAAAAAAAEAEAAAEASGLPSAAAIFAEVEGPPDFLRAAAQAAPPQPQGLPDHGVFAGAPTARRRAQPAMAAGAGSAAEARPQDVRNGGGGPRALASRSVAAACASEERRQIGAPMPPLEDAAVLLQVCPRCQVPKTFSTSHGGMTCPLCSDRPPPENSVEEDKKRRGPVKDKEKAKRMKGQSSHATWKSETEMHLRQQFD